MIFNQRTAVVTGAGGGIGRAICRKLHRAGVAVVAADRTMEAANQAIAEISGDGGAPASAYAMDVADSASVAAAAKMILNDFSKVDILINNAGVWVHSPGGARPLIQLKEEEWRSFIEINLCGVFRVTQAFLGGMLDRKYGRIVNLGSISGEVGLPNFCDYSAAKGGVILLTKSLAMEVAKQGVTVNCVSPGMVNGSDEEPPAPTAGTWIGRCGRRDEIADLICYLAADESGYITGVDYTIDGGRILGPKQSC